MMQKPLVELGEEQCESGLTRSGDGLGFSSAPDLSPEAIIREIRQLPSTPRVLPRLKRLLCDTNSSIYEIVALIRLDPGIATRVLQVGNSAYFSRGGARCLTVEEAVARVGFDQIFELVSFAVASQVLVRPLEVYGMENDAAWRLSVACAFAAEELAAYGDIERDVAYTIGLVHCVGMVAIDEWALRQHFPIRLQNRGFPLDASESEQSQLGFSQAEVGATLLCDWDFPSEITEPVRSQYRLAVSAAGAKTVSVLATAKWIRSAVCEDRTPPPLPAALLRSLRLSTAALQRIVASVRCRLACACSMLEFQAEVPASVERPDRVKFPTWYPGTPSGV